MKILITGNLGYIGPTLVKYLKKNIENTNIVGFDSGFFAHCLTGTEQFPERYLDTQIFGDTRNISENDLIGFDSVIHLAAVSNDPMGKQFEAVTEDINRVATIELAKKCSRSKVKNFVFASSCSMYGSASNAPKTENDETNPLTAYARSKIGAEEDFKSMDLAEMLVTSLRFATACGMSDRLRLDLVLNDFVACSLLHKEITVLSDGSPWRPLIDVEDMSRAIHWASIRDSYNDGNFLAVNTGSNKSNYQVKDLANKVGEIVTGCKISINTDAPPDLRSYKVDFSLFESLAPKYIPKLSLTDSIERLVEGINKMNFSDKNFRESNYMRLKMLQSHMKNNLINKNLEWL